MINLRLDPRLIDEIDSVVNNKKENYTSRTDLIRQAIRNLLEEYRKQHALFLLNKYFGYGKKRGIKTTDEDIERVKEEVWQEYRKKFEKD